VISAAGCPSTLTGLVEHGLVPHKRAAVKVTGLPLHALAEPVFGNPRSSSSAMAQAPAWSAALSMPLEFRKAATRAAFCTAMKA
jgi:hypothetical protein